MTLIRRSQHSLRRASRLFGLLSAVFLVVSVVSFSQAVNAADGNTTATGQSTRAQYLTQINIDASATSGGHTGKGIVVGIFDGGVNLDNPLLKTNGISKVVRQSCVGSSAEVQACNTTPGHEASINCATDDIGCYHGMSVANFVSGNSATVNLASGQASLGGVAPDVKLSYVREAMSRKGAIAYKDFVAALNVFVNDIKTGSSAAPDVVNLSLSFPRADFANCNVANEVKTAIDYLVNAGTVVVAATGNDHNKSQVSYPACMSNVIAVGSTNINGASETVSDFSNMSSDVDLVAPGQNLWAPMPATNRYAQVSGTSFAAPLVSGAVAVIKQAHPGLTPAEIKELLVSSGDNVTDAATGKTFKRINLGHALGIKITSAPVVRDAQVQAVQPVQRIAQPAAPKPVVTPAINTNRKVVVTKAPWDANKMKIMATSLTPRPTGVKAFVGFISPYSLYIVGIAFLGAVLCSGLLLRRTTVRV